MLTARQAEKVSRKGYRVIENMDAKGQLPFDRVREPGRRQRFSPFEAFLLRLHSEICSQWALLIAEATTILTTTAPELLAQWQALHAADLWLVREKLRDGTFGLWLMTKAGLIERLAEEPEEEVPFTWSAEAMAVERAMLARGASEEAIQRAMVAIDRARMAAWGKERPQTLWLLPVSQILTQMCEEAQQQHIALPPLEDRKAWLMPLSGDAQ